MLKLQGEVSQTYLTSNHKNRGKDVHGVSETLMCNSSNHTRPGAGTPTVKRTHTHTHTLLTLPQIGLSQWSNERGDVWGRSGWERDRRSERDWERAGEIESCRGSWGGCVWRENDHGKSVFFLFCFVFLAPLQTVVWLKLQHYVSQARFTRPKQIFFTDKRL